jgi:hypothetical protein
MEFKDYRSGLEILGQYRPPGASRRWHADASHSGFASTRFKNAGFHERGRWPQVAGYGINAYIFCYAPTANFDSAKN